MSCMNIEHDFRNRIKIYANNFAVKSKSAQYKINKKYTNGL